MVQRTHIFFFVALREMAQGNVEWYSVHTNSVALREMAQRNVEWYSVHTNGVELHEMAQRNVEWYILIYLTSLCFWW